MSALLVTLNEWDEIVVLTPSSSIWRTPPPLPPESLHVEQVPVPALRGPTRLRPAARQRATKVNKQ